MLTGLIRPSDLKILKMPMDFKNKQPRRYEAFMRYAALILFGMLILACTKNKESKEFENLGSFAKRYAKAWSGQIPDSVAAFFSEDGTLRVNDGDPAVGRVEIAQVASSFMTDLPDMQVVYDSLVDKSTGPEFHWTLIGTNTGPGGTGNKVEVSGYEVWKMSKDMLIEKSQGHFPSEEYNRQLGLNLSSREEFIDIDFSELSAKLATTSEDLSPEEVMRLFYPYQADAGEGDEKIGVSQKELPGGTFEVELIHDNLLDDSMKAKKYVMHLKIQDRKWKVLSLKNNWTCWPGRGHESWGTEFCD